MRVSRRLGEHLRYPSTMSCIPVDSTGVVCAKCGQSEGGTVKLKNCTACRLVKYCGVDCQRAHRKQHKEACKQRAAELKEQHKEACKQSAAELKDESLCHGHTRPEWDFCPICTLPMRFKMEDHSFFYVCCVKRICEGCAWANQKRGMYDCPFCRTPFPDNDAHRVAMIRARVEKKDPDAMNSLGEQYYVGLLGLQKDMGKAIDLYTEAAELGSVAALSNLGHAYSRGRGVEIDLEKGIEFFKKAAIQGDAESRFNLGLVYGMKMNYDMASRHWLISAKMGHDKSLEAIKKLFMDGIVTKEQYADALRGYQDAVVETKSQDREEAMAKLRVRPPS